MTRPPSWGPVYRNLSRCGKLLSPNARVVLMNLMERDGDRGIFPSQATIAADLGLTEKPIRAALGELERVGVVRKVRYAHGKGNAYELDYAELDGFGLNGRFSRSTPPPSTGDSPAQPPNQREIVPLRTGDSPAQTPNQREILPTEDPPLEDPPLEDPKGIEDPGASPAPRSSNFSLRPFLVALNDHRSRYVRKGLPFEEARRLGARDAYLEQGLAQEDAERRAGLEVAG